MNFAPLFAMIILWTTVGMIVDYLKKRGSKLAEDKPIYNKIRWGIYIVLAIGGIVLILLMFIMG